MATDSKQTWTIGKVNFGNAIHRIVNDLHEQGVFTTESEVRREVLESARRNQMPAEKIVGYLVAYPEAQRKFGNVLTSTQEIAQARARARELAKKESPIPQVPAAVQQPKRNWARPLIQFGLWLSAMFGMLFFLFRAMKGHQR